MPLGALFQLLSSNRKNKKKNERKKRSTVPLRQNPKGMKRYESGLIEIKVEWV